MQLQSIREALVYYGKKMEEDGLIIGTGGNLSAKDEETGLIAITPSGVPYDTLTPEEIVLVNEKGAVLEGGKPSSELSLHLTLYKEREDFSAIVHTHSTYCTTLSALGEPIRAVHYLIGNAGVHEVPCVPYVTFGTDALADACAHAIGQSKAALLGNHGLICGENSLKEAYHLALSMEFVAEIQWRAMSAGTPKLIRKEQMDDALIRFESYGQ